MSQSGTPAGGATADLVATHDGPAKALLNVGLIWWRATAATLQLALRVENRTFGGWEQAILNEEASFFSKNTKQTT